MNIVSERDIGRLEAEVVALKAHSAETRADIKELRSDVKQLMEALSEAKGGWKVLFAMGTASAAAGASIVKLLAFMKGG